MSIEVMNGRETVGKQNGAKKESGPRYQVPALARGLKIIEFLAGRPKGATVAEIVEALRLPTPSVFRMIATFLDGGYVQRDVEGAVYRLSRKLLALGYSAVDGQGLVEKSLDVLRKLRDATGETALIAVLSGNEGVVLEQAPSPRAVKVLVQVGHRFPLHTAAPGKALLAFLPDSERETLLTSLTYEKFTARTLTSRRSLAAQLDEVRKTGVAYDRGEELDDLRCVGAPVLDAHGYPLAAIWVSGPASRIGEAELNTFADLTFRHARMISARFSL